MVDLNSDEGFKRYTSEAAKKLIHDYTEYFLDKADIKEHIVIIMDLHLTIVSNFVSHIMTGLSNYVIEKYGDKVLNERGREHLLDMMYAQITESWKLH